MVLNLADFDVQAILLHACQSLIIYSLDQAEFGIKYDINAPSFFAHLEQEEKEDLKDLFNNTYVVNEMDIINCFCWYIEYWISSLTSIIYKKTFY